MGAPDDSGHGREHVGLARADRRASPLFTRIAALGDEFQDVLLAVLCDGPELRRWVRDCLIF
jgi:hypothetical protein